MSTYYKYVDRDVDQQINWANVGGQLSKSLLDRQADLAKQKAAINKDSRDLLSQLNNPELGTNRDINTLIIDGGMKLSETQKSLNTLFNKGLLSQNEYLQASQNIKTNADTFSKLGTQWNEASEAGYKAIKDGTASLASADNLGFAQNIFNPNTVGIVVDDKGNLFLGNKVLKKVDGVDVISVDPSQGKLQSVNNYSSLLKTGIVPKYDVSKFTEIFNTEKQKFIQIIKETEPTIFAKGMQFVEDNVAKNAKFIQAVNDRIKGETTPPLNKLSILFDGVGKDANGNAFEVDFTGKKQGDNIVQAKITPTGIDYSFTDKQEELASNFLLNQVEGKVSVEQKKIYENQLNDAALERAKLAEQKRVNKKKESKEDNNSKFAGKVLAKAARPRSIQEGNESASNMATLGGWDTGTYDSSDGGSYTFTKGDVTKVVKLGGKNLKSSIEDFATDVFGQFSGDLDMGVVTSTANETANEYTPNAVQTRVNKVKGWNGKGKGTGN